MKKTNLRQSKTYIIRCECSDVQEHALHVHQWNIGDDCDDSELGHVNIHTRLDIRVPWYKRIVVGVKYMFGFTDYMNFTETIVDVEVLKELVQKLEDNRSDEQKAAAKENRDWTKFEIL